MIEAVIAAALVWAEGAEPAGRYRIEGAQPPCTLRLQPSLPNLPQALMTGDAQSGFAFAAPGCPAGLESLSLWRFETESQTLTLVDEAGEPLLEAVQQDGVWTAQAESGRSLRLIRD